MEQYTFAALLARMKYINRWGLMRAARPETLSEHTAEVAMLGHILALLARNKFGVSVRPKTIAVAALYHDAGEIVTGDLPTPVKYKNQQLQQAYKALERETMLSYLDLLPPEIRDDMRMYVVEDELTERERRLLKAADRLSALIKCIEEEESGNREFLSAQKEQTAALRAMDLPEVAYFMDHMLPAYRSTLDELIAPAHKGNL